MIRGSVDIPSLCRGNATCPLWALLATAEPKVMFRFGEDKPRATQHVTRVSQALESRIKDPFKMLWFSFPCFGAMEFWKEMKRPEVGLICWYQLIANAVHASSWALSTMVTSQSTMGFELEQPQIHPPNWCLVDIYISEARTNCLGNCLKWSEPTVDTAGKPCPTAGSPCPTAGKPGPFACEALPLKRQRPAAVCLMGCSTWTSERTSDALNFNPMPSAKNCTRSRHQIPRSNVTVSVPTILSSSCYFILVGNTCHRMSRWQ